MTHIALHDAVALPVSALDKLMPMHLLVAGDGRITGYGPTLAKLLDGPSLLGQSLFAAFELRRPAGLQSTADLRAYEGQKLRLSLRAAGGRPMSFRGVALSLADGLGMVVNLSFGIGVVDAVRNFALTDADFAPTDLAVEMMYLVEAKSAAMNALRGLAQRLEGAKQVAEERSLTDTLTGLRNRRALTRVLDSLARAQAPYGLMHLDLDFFKAVNDTLGHAAGDHVLKVVARLLELETRHGDTVARVGGDEFVLVFPTMTDTMRLETIARRIIEQLSAPIEFEGQECRISASIGITMTTQYDHPDPEQMQSDADEALYASKRAGRGRAHLHRPSGSDRRRA
jgi:diguanylate cyclase (GGDEF)-like protein